MQIMADLRRLWVPAALLLLSCAATSSTQTNREESLQTLLAAETFLINNLRNYIESLEGQLRSLKTETEIIQNIHDEVGEEVELYLNNPLNSVTILKRFITKWTELEQQANATHKLNFTLDSKELNLPSENDYESSVANLLTLQTIYELEAESLSMGIVYGQKLGSSMSWSDCLEMGRKSDHLGNYVMAKFWLETALGKVPDAFNETEHTNTTPTLMREGQRARMHILEATINMEYRAGQFREALTATEELLQLRPNRKSAIKAKQTIESQLEVSTQSQRPKTKLPKSAEQQLIEELCRAAPSVHQQFGDSEDRRFTQCTLGYEAGNGFLLLQPKRLELLSMDPYIALEHNVLTERQLNELLTLLDEMPADGNSFGFSNLKLSHLGEKKLKRWLRKVSYQYSGAFWQTRRYGHEHVTIQQREPEHLEYAARAVLNLQSSQLGGAVLFPQLELSVHVPRGSLLYWSTGDYRSRHTVCPVLLGAHISAWTSLSLGSQQHPHHNSPHSCSD